MAKKSGGNNLPPSIKKVKIHCRQAGCNERVIECDAAGRKARERQLKGNGYTILRVE